MFNHPFLRKTDHILRRHWLVAICVAGFVGILWMGAPAWAAPVARPLSQGGTVPRPTATPDGPPIATATPGGPDIIDETGDDGEVDPENGTDATLEEDSEDGTGSANIDFPVDEAGNPIILTAQVTVNALNMRDGPGTAFNVLGSLPVNTEVTVLSRNEDATWWYVCCLPGTETTGWVSAQLLTPAFDGAEATTLLPLFGATPVETPAAAATPETAGQTLPQAELPLAVDFKIDPFFVWQGITATLTITVNNPNTVDAVDVLLSDEIPEGLIFIEAEADAGGTLETVVTTAGRPLLLFRWATIPADTAVSVTIVTQIEPTLPGGTLIDNLVATRGRNIMYSTDAITLGMPPIIPPEFE